MGREREERELERGESGAQGDAGDHWDDEGRDDEWSCVDLKPEHSERDRARRGENAL
jgi:hypothetical protein